MRIAIERSRSLTIRFDSNWCTNTHTFPILPFSKVVSSSLCFISNASSGSFVPGASVYKITCITIITHKPWICFTQLKNTRFIGRRLQEIQVLGFNVESISVPIIGSPVKISASADFGCVDCDIYFGTTKSVSDESSSVGLDICSDLFGWVNKWTVEINVSRWNFLI